MFLTKAQWGIESTADEGFIIPHSRDVEYVRHSRPFGVSFSVVKKVSDTLYPLCDCYPLHKFRYAYFDFNNAVLGQSHLLYYSLVPRFRWFGNLFFSITASAGLTYNNRPYHPLHNPDNNSYSMYVNGYLGLGAGWAIRPHPRWEMSAAFIYHHISNGGIRDPNKGINWPAASMQYTYFLGRKNKRISDLRNEQPAHDVFDKTKYFFITSIYGSGRIIDKGDKKRWPVYGWQLGAYRKVSGLSLLFAEADAHRDHAAAEKLRRMGLSPSDFYLSVAGGHGFLLGKFVFRQGAGIYFIRPASLHPLWYHRWGLAYFFNKKIFTEISLKAHRHVAHFLDFRVGVVLWEKQR